MPSRAEPARIRIEWAARASAFALLAWAVWRALVPAAPVERVIDGADLHGELGDVLTQDRATHVRVRNAVTPAQRDVLAAARRAGARVSWSADSAPVWAAAAAPERGPGGLVRVAVVGMGKCRGRGTVEDRGRGTVEDRGTGTGECASSGVLADTLGVIDTVSLLDGGATATLTPARGLTFNARGAQIPLVVAPRDTLPWRALVLARAGWEAKFVMAALEEQAWTVSARLVVAPGVDVTQGAPRGLDRSAIDRAPVAQSVIDRSAINRPRLTLEQFDVVVVLDSALINPDAAAITAFVRGGGGVVLAGEGALALRSIAPAVLSGPLTRAPRGDTVVTRESLPMRALTGLRADAVLLETRGRAATVAARAEGAGRVVQLGYDDTWRWRMQGGATAVADHRTFWARALSGAAPDRGTLPLAPEGTPRARLVDAWGPMTAAPAGSPSGWSLRWLWPLLAMLLVAEWMSRRTRGAA